MKFHRMLAVSLLMLSIPALTQVARASTLIGTTNQGVLGGGPVDLMDSVGFIKGKQIFSESFDVTIPGTLTVTLSDVPWLDVVQGLNCFLTAPGGGFLGGAQNGNSESVPVMPGTLYVNWYGQANGALSLGAYGIKVEFQPAALPTPLPPAAVLMLSGLAGLAGLVGLVGWRRRPRLPVAADA
jgi:hypothetical protein